MTIACFWWTLKLFEMIVVNVKRNLVSWLFLAIPIFNVFESSTVYCLCSVQLCVCVRVCVCVHMWCMCDMVHVFRAGVYLDDAYQVPQHLMGQTFYAAVVLKVKSTLVQLHSSTVVDYYYVTGSGKRTHPISAHDQFITKLSRWYERSLPQLRNETSLTSVASS